LLLGAGYKKQYGHWQKPQSVTHDDLFYIILRGDTTNVGEMFGENIYWKRGLYFYGHQGASHFHTA
jgi:hypothetical protein